MKLKTETYKGYEIGFGKQNQSGAIFIDYSIPELIHNDFVEYDKNNPMSNWISNSKSYINSGFVTSKEEYFDYIKRVIDYKLSKK